ncbi:RadC family protein [Aliiruegeria sabulilitoris]|uniref:RadC family protein n=1 Tax=Aliiruegeria sabulilitoris TaxID=1510458 RepID=UPI0009E961E1|nr:DNA repair protein RadC [Aliiruegeria sabulilitoris]NDR56966.1 JAB domain-containing protein [Pseudoruegeria sp. M32A2M]
MPTIWDRITGRDKRQGTVATPSVRRPTYKVTARRAYGGGFSEASLRGLDDLDARLPPPGVETRPASEPGFRRTERLNADVTAGGGLVKGDDGQVRPHYWGHRERLRQRFLSGGHAAMPEYELLELLLFNAIPRIDVKPLAKRLLAAFGDLNGVIAAPEARLMEVEGATPKVFYQLRLAEAFAHRMARAKVMQRPVLSSWDALMEYCKTVMAHRDTEQFRVLFLDRKNNLVADEAQAEGTVDHVPVYPREIVKRALELNASALILVHNHPSGDPSPSNEDVVMTDRISEACQAVGITIHDHVVIGKEEDASFRQLGFLE